MNINTSNPMDMLKHKASTPQFVAGEMKSLPINSWSDNVVVQDVYKHEDYQFKTPGFLKFGLFAKKLSEGEALKSLKDGKKVVVEENIEIRGNFSDQTDYVIGKDKIKTTLESMDDLEAFARIESGAEPQSQMEKTGQMLENDFNYGSQFEHVFSQIVDKNDKPVSSFDATKTLESGNSVWLNRDIELHSTKELFNHKKDDVYMNNVVDRYMFGNSEIKDSEAASKIFKKKY